MMSLAISLVCTPEEKKRLADILAKSRSISDEWDMRHEQSLTTELLRKTEGDAAVVRFMEDNVENSDFRAQLIERAFSSRDYETVIRLAHDGIRHDEREHPGRANRWREYLLRVFRETGDNKNATALLRTLLIRYSQVEKWRIRVICTSVSSCIAVTMPVYVEICLEGRLHQF